MEIGTLDRQAEPRPTVDRPNGRSVALPADERLAEPPRLAFLAYLNRSGSTFLARLLAGYADVAVSLEAQFDDGLVRAGRRVRDRFELESLIDDLLADPKFAAWGVDPDRLRRRLEDGGYPVRFPALLRASLAEAFDGEPARVHLYKNGRVLERPDAFRRMFPDAKVIFVLRDPRAVHASQRRSADSRTGRPMTSHPVVTARRFVRAVRTLERFVESGWLHVVRFEDLVQDPEGECARVLEFLGVSARRRPDGGAYAERIPDAQRHLHPNVGGGARRERTAAWESELSPRDVALVEDVAGPEMERCGYAPAASGPAGGGLPLAVDRATGELRWLLRRARWNLVTRPRL